MKPTDVCPDGPFEVDVKIHITDGNNTGVITVGLASGIIPTADKFHAALAEARAAAKAAGMRLMDRHEFITDMLNDGPIAVPGSKQFAELKE
jgi:hypothetical protein